MQIETSIAVLPQNSDVSIKIDDGSVIQTKNMSSLIMGLSSPVDVFLEVVDKDKKEKVIGGKLVMAQGHYKKGAGIAIPKGSEAKVLFRDAIYSGKIDEDVLIGMSMLEMRPSPLA